MVVYTFGVFAKPVAGELKTSRGSIALAVSILDIMVAIGAPGAGLLVDRYGTRGVIVGSLGVFRRVLWRCVSFLQRCCILTLLRPFPGTGALGKWLKGALYAL